jgi:signal transduction histidine kinase
VRGLGTWRDFRRLRGRLGESLAGMTERLAATELRLAHAGETAQRLDRARSDLQESLAEARLLADAAGEAKDLVDRLRGVVPRR